MIRKFINKRYRDVYEQCIHKGESTPFTLGTLVVCGFCFLLILISTYTQINIPVFHFGDEKTIISYCPQIPISLFIIYLLQREYSFIVFLLYLIIGLFFLPIFAFGGGISYFQNYFFGYFLGVFPAIIISGTIIKLAFNVKARLIAGLAGILTIHFCGILYCLILALFKVIDFSLISAIANVMSGDKIFYDIIFGTILLLIAPYIKNVFWICMQPKPKRKKIAPQIQRQRQKQSTQLIQQKEV